MVDSSDNEGPPHVTRRDLVAGGASLGLAVIGGCAGGAKKWETTPVDIVDGQITLDVTEHPPLATAGGMVAVHPAGLRKPIMVLRGENAQFTVLSMKCTHLGCTVRWDNDKQNIVCACHGSRFTDTGAVLKGPAKEGLSAYRWSFEELVLRIQVPDQA